MSSVPFGRRRIVSSSFDQRLKLWTIDKRGGCLKTYTGHTDFVRCVATFHNGDAFVSASDDGTVGVLGCAHACMG